MGFSITLNLDRDKDSFEKISECGIPPTRHIRRGNVLSLGEQQRIAFAHLFLRKPKFAFLDEATSALDEENQGDLYRLLKESQISYISVGHRTTLIQYHNRLLTLDRSGSWEIEAAEIS